jgi:nitroreductase
MKTILEALNRRYATKAYDTTKKVSDEDLHTILESMRLSPSSFGLQPWKFIVVTDETIRSQLLVASRSQTQVTDASHLVILAVKKDITEEDINTFITSVATTRNIPVESLDGYKGIIIGATQNLDQAAKQIWNSKQAYIALGIGLTTAALLWVDATPMEGFDANAYNEILGLTDYTTSVILPIGYRAEWDVSQHYAKVRFNAEQIIEYR